MYFNGTLTETLCDAEGKFELDVSKSFSMPLVISAIGYKSATLPDYSGNNSFVIYLLPKAFFLDGVIITDGDDVRKTFKREFLGKTRNAHKYEISNEKEIKFMYDMKAQTLKAFSLKPIIIINKELGYKITYFLETFEYCKTDKTLSLYGKL